MTDLQELSREAARKLPKEWDALVVECGKAVWLHESTEACTEIMVRVLWPKQWFVGLAPSGTVQAFQDSCDGDFRVVENYEPDAMQAFRTAVLRAVVAL